jgi:hypothetical protein
MATPAYNAAWRNQGGFRHRGGWGSRGRTWGIVTGHGSMLGGNTPQYLGAGQPTPEDTGSFFGADGTPIYRSAPAPLATTAPSTTPSDATAPPSDPQPGQMAIVVRRS